MGYKYIRSDGDDMMNSVLVLTTVNAPHSTKLNAQELAHCLLDHAVAKTMPGHMSAFFGEVEPEHQLAFAELFNIPQSQLVAAAKKFSNYSGELYPLAA